MSSILNLVTGGGLLPHIYCRKVTLERSSADASLVDITLLLEVYQDKNALSNSTWLNNLGTQGTNFLDAMFIQVLPYTEKENVMKLFANTDALGTPGNLYTAKTRLGDGYLPRGAMMPMDETGSTTGTLFASVSPPPPPIQISNSSLLGNLAAKNALSEAAAQGKVREEIVNGRVYYAIPFEYKKTDFNPKGDYNNLGFAFYSFLNIPYWVKGLEIDGTSIDMNLYQDMLEELIIEGPVNSEIVFINGKVQNTRQAFFLPGGEVWEGSAHLHATGINPAPASAGGGYHGDGGLSGAPSVSSDGTIIDSGPDFRGWMVGERHLNSSQPKLKLAEVPNNKIVDFRHGLFPEPLDEALGLGTKTQVFSLQPEIDQMIEGFVTPFQKEKKRDFVKDNDSEYSKLYITRDSENRARGLFFIDIKELLINNSTLFPMLFDKAASSNQNISQVIAAFIVNTADLLSILQRSKILDLKVFRERVNKNLIGTRYENYSNDTPYEEPPHLVATIADIEFYKTPSQSGAIKEIEGINSADDPMTTTGWTRYFTFADTEISKKTAGAYQYRLELKFKDGTYEFLYDLLKELSNIKAATDEYYALSTSFFTKETTVIEANKSRMSETYSKAFFKKYFHNGVFVDEFLVPASLLAEKTNITPWISAPSILTKVQRIFGAFPASDSAGINFQDESIANMMSPGPTGSPAGIDFFSRLLGVSINKVQSLLGAAKVNKTGSEIDASTVPNGYNFNAFLDTVVSPSDCTIIEEYTFDHPNELFHVVSNKNIFMDYLSIGFPYHSHMASGLRYVNTVKYKDRCQLEAAKFSPIAKNFDGFSGLIDGSNIGKAVSSIAPGAGVIGGEDSFSRTGYSYLSPSIIKLEDPIQDSNAYNFEYSAFGYNAKSYLEDPNINANSLFSGKFNSWRNYDKLLISLKNYKLNKEESPNADLTDAFSSSEKDDIFQNIMDIREPFKRTFEEYGITLHSAGLYNKYFNKPAGAHSLPQETTSKRLSPLQPDDYSDGLLNPVNFFKNFAFNAKQKLISMKWSLTDPRTSGPEAVGSEPLVFRDLPNNFKIKEIAQNHMTFFSQDILQPPFRQAFNSGAGSHTYNSFFFFQFHLTMRIEVFRGGTHIGRWNAKNDEGDWQLLEEGDLDLLEGEKLFCRMVLYDESMARDLELPVLDKYFLINKSPWGTQPAPVIPLPVSEPSSTGYDPSSTNFWLAQTKQKLKQAAAATGQNFTAGQEMTAADLVKKKAINPTEIAQDPGADMGGGYEGPDTGGGGGAFGGGGSGGGGGYT